MNSILKIECMKNGEQLQELYPNGIQNFFLDSINLHSDESGLDFYLWVQDKPAVIHDKWGTWNEDFNTVILQFSCSLNKSISIQNWQNNFVTGQAYRCNAEFTSCEANDCGIKDEKDNTLHFWGNDWDVKIVTKIIIFQSYNTKAVYYSDDQDDL